MAVDTLKSGSMPIVGGRYNLMKPLDGIVYPVLELAIGATILAVAVGLAFAVLLPGVESFGSRIPFIGGIVGESAGGTNPSWAN